MANNPPSAPQAPGGNYYPVLDQPPVQPHNPPQAAPYPYPVPPQYPAGQPQYQGVQPQYAGGMQPPYQGGQPQYQGGQPQYPGGMQPIYPQQGIPLQQAQQGAPLIYAGQPVGGNQYQPVSGSARMLGLVFIGLSIVVVILSIVCLCVHEWVHYCYYRISLTDAYYEQYSGSLSDLKRVYCDDFSSIDFGSCGDMCTNFEDLYSGGKSMRGLGIAATISTGVSILRMFLLIIRPRRWCRGLIMRLSLLFATMMWLAGTIIYIGIYAAVHSDASKSKIGPGLSLAIAIAVILMVNCVLGNVVVSKLT